MGVKPMQRTRQSHGNGHSLPPHKFKKYVVGNPDYQGLLAGGSMDDMGYLYVVEVYVNNFMSLFIPMRRVQLRHVDNAIMNGIHDVFPPNDIDSKDPIKDVNGDLASGAFSYSSVVGMLLYLSGHTLPNITFAVNCCSRYMFCPKHSHELALKQIVCYLKQTPD